MKEILQTAKIWKPKMAICLMAVLFTCLWPIASLASWSQAFSENGIYGGSSYNITKVEVFYLNGTSGLESPGMSNLTPGIWTVQMPTTDYVVATNTTGISSFNWLFSFKGTPSDSLSLAYLAYTDTDDVFGTYINRNYDGFPNWSFPTIANVNPADYDLYRPASAVPIPPTVFLLSIGLLSFVGIRRKFNITSPN